MAVAVALGDGRELARRHDRVAEHLRARRHAQHRAPRGHVLAEQRAHDVAVQHRPFAVDDGGDGATVCVWIVGDYNVGPYLLGKRDRQIDGAGLLRIGEGDRGEVGVGDGLFCHLEHVGEARGGEHARHALGADSVHARDDHAGVRAAVVGGGARASGRGRDVVVNDRVGDDVPPALGARHPKHGGHCGDVSGNLRVVWRHNL